MADSWLKDIIGNAAFDALKDDFFADTPESPPQPAPVPEELVKSMERMSSRLREIQRERPGAKRRNHAAYLRSRAIDIGDLAHGVEYWILPNSMSEECGRLRQAEKDGNLPVGFCERLKTMMGMEGALNGYVAFNKRHSPLPVRDRGIGDGILAYVPVHGGITYMNKDQTACVFGFDTAHYNSEHFPRTDKNWIQWQCRVLYEGLVIAGKIEKDYLRAVGNNERRLQILQPLVDLMPEEDLSIGAIVNLLRGAL